MDGKQLANFYGAVVQVSCARWLIVELFYAYKEQQKIFWKREVGH